MSADVDQEPMSEEEDAAAGALAMALRDSGLFEPEKEDEPVPAEQPAEDSASEDDSAEEVVSAEAVEEVAAAEAPEETENAETAEAADVPETAEASPDESDGGTAETAEAAPDESDGEAAEASPDESEAEEGEGDTEEEEVAAKVKPENPYELPGDWYVIHSYSGYENKVKANLETRISTMHMNSSVFDVVIPMEDVVEIKGGKKVTVPKKVLPGYLLVRMYMDDDAWFTVRNTPGVTGFVGNGTKPSPLTRREVERFLGTPEEEGEETKAAPRFKPAWDVGESVRVVDGPFADFNGVIDDINLDQSKVRVLVNIFDRETPVELTFEQIVKI